jgi:hypothetical protein
VPLFVLKQQEAELFSLCIVVYDIRLAGLYMNKERKKFCHYLASTSAAIFLRASSVVLIIPSFAQPFLMPGMPDKSTCQVQPFDDVVAGQLLCYKY